MRTRPLRPLDLRSRGRDCFFVFDAPSGRDAALTAERAELDPIRIVEAVSSRKELS